MSVFSNIGTETTISNRFCPFLLWCHQLRTCRQFRCLRSPRCRLRRCFALRDAISRDVRDPFSAQAPSRINCTFEQMAITVYFFSNKLRRRQTVSLLTCKASSLRHEVLHAYLNYLDPQKAVNSICTARVWTPYESWNIKEIRREANYYWNPLYKCPEIPAVPEIPAHSLKFL